MTGDTATPPGSPPEADGVDALSGVYLLGREIRRHLTDLLGSERWLADAGLRPPCLWVVAVVDRCQPVSQREIGDHLDLDASDVVGALDVLEAAGMVERRRDPADRRRHAVVLTPEGEQAARRFEVLRAQAEARSLARLDPEERRQLATLLAWALDRPLPATPPAAPSASGD